MQSKKVFFNFIWRFAERCGAQLVAFAVSVILARVLEPDTYGTIALMLVFTNIVQVFVDSGFGNALIQKKDADDIDFSTVFYTNVVLCFLAYMFLYFSAPFIASFYHDASMSSMIRVLSLTVVISGLKNVQQAYVSRHMMFKRFFYSTLGGTICAAVVGVLLAYMGYGAWALVIQQVLNVGIDTLILWITVRWRPIWTFSMDRLKVLFSYGWKLLISGLLDVTYNNLRTLIIGKKYSSSDLAFYNHGMRFPELIVVNINSSIDSVLLPAMSNVQDERTHVKNMTSRSIRVSVYVMAPLMMGLAFVAPILIPVLLTDKWIPCVFYLRIFCISYMFYPIHTANLNAIKALGRSDLFLKLEIYKKILGMILLLSTMWFGVKVMAYSVLIGSVISQLINAQPNKKLLDYGYLEQLRDICPSILLAAAMGLAIYPLGRLEIPSFMILIMQVILGALFYIVGSIIFKIDSFYYILEILKSIRIGNRVKKHVE